MAKARQVDLIVTRGTVVVGYNGSPVKAINERGVEVTVSMGEEIAVGPGGRITVDADEAERLLARGVCRLPATDNDLPAPVGSMPKVGITADDGVQITEG